MDVRLVRVGGDDIPWQEAVIRRVALFESAGDPFTAQLRNDDGQGLSFGLIQWTQRSGQLGLLLSAMWAADTDAFEAAVGGRAAADELLRVTRASTESARLAPVAGASLWSEPWTSRFRALGGVRAFQRVQVELAQRGYHWTQAARVADLLGPRTWSPRAWAVFFDRAVQTPSRLIEEATALRGRFGAGLASVSEWSLLDHLISAVAARYSGKTAWDIRTRRGDALLADASLSDAPVAAA